MSQVSKSAVVSKISLNGIDNNLYLDGKSLWLFGIENKLRVKLFNILTNIKFDYFIIMIIMFSSIHLALENPLNDPDGML